MVNRKSNLYLPLLLPQTQFLVTFYVEIPGMMQPNFKNLFWYFLCNNSWKHIDVFFCDFAWTYDVTLHYIPCDMWHLAITTNFCSHLANMINLSYISLVTIRGTKINPNITNPFLHSLSIISWKYDVT